MEEYEEVYGILIFEVEFNDDVDEGVNDGEIDFWGGFCVVNWEWFLGFGWFVLVIGLWNGGNDWWILRSGILGWSDC